MGCSDPPSVFSRGGSLLPSSYADARYIDAVIVSKAVELGFDSVKLDSGFPVGSNLTLWADAFNKSGQSL